MIPPDFVLCVNFSQGFFFKFIFELIESSHFLPIRTDRIVDHLDGSLFFFLFFSFKIRNVLTKHVDSVYLLYIS